MYFILLHMKPHIKLRIWDFGNLAGDFISDLSKLFKTQHLSRVTMILWQRFVRYFFLSETVNEF